MIFFTMFGFSLNGQISCNTVDLKAGLPSNPDVDCFVKRVGVWFEYQNGQTPPQSNFPYCTIDENQINTELIVDMSSFGGVIEEIEFANVGSYSTSSSMFMDGTWRVRIYDDVPGPNSSPMYFDFGSADNPLFYVYVSPESTSSFDLQLTLNQGFGYNISDNCSGVTCTLADESFTIPGAANVSCPAGGTPYGLEFFVDTDPADVVYDPATNESIVTVKARNTNGDLTIPVDRLAFAIDVTDVMANLIGMDDNLYLNSNFDVVSSEHSPLSQSGNSFFYDIGSGDDNPVLHFNNGECALFEIRLKAPFEPLEAGEVTFDFDYTKVEFAYAYDGICCSPNGVSSQISIGNYNEGCGTDTPFKLVVNDFNNSNDCTTSFAFPVTFAPNNGYAVQNLYFTEVTIEVEVMASQEMQIDVTSTMNSLNASFPSGSMVITGNTILVHFSDLSGVEFATDDGLFDIYISGTSGGQIDDLYFKNSYYSWGVGSVDKCVSDFEKNIQGGYALAAYLGEKGKVVTVNGESLSDLLVAINDVNAVSSPCGFPTSETNTGSDGSFEFDCQEDLFSTGVCSDVSDDWVNGVTTFDLVLIAKHILGVQTFDKIWKFLAADANDSGSVSTLDIIQLRKLILGIYTELPAQDNWLYAAHTPEELETLWNSQMTAPDYNAIKYFYANRQYNNSDLNFTAIKVGDVNGSADASSKGGEVNEKLYITLIDKGLDNKGDFKIGFDPHVFESMVGLEMTIQPNLSKLDYFDWSNESLVDVNTDVFYKKNGEVNIAWYSSSGKGIYLDGNEELFSLNCTPQVTGYGITDVSLDNTEIYGHAYRSDGRVFDIELDYGGKKGGNKRATVVNRDAIQVLGTGSESMLQVKTKQSQNIDIVIYDLQGKLVMRKGHFVEEGTTSIPLPANHWAAGLYLIQVNMTDGVYSTKWVK